MSAADDSIWLSGYELTMPLNITLANGKTCVCESVVRAMPSRRYVCKGDYNGQASFIKLFSLSKKAQSEWEKEQVGITNLSEANIAAPEILFAGYNQNKTTLVIVYAELVLAESAQHFWQHRDKTKRLHLLNDLVKLVAHHHIAGLNHTDLHLLNFIYSQDVLYTLDAGDIKKSVSALSLKQSIHGLADLLALLPVEYDRYIEEYYVRYSTLRNIEVTDKDITCLKDKVIKKRKYKLRKYLEKTFRSCSAFAVLKDWNKYVVYDRLLGTDSLRRLLLSPDKAMATQNLSIIKDGNTCTVYEFEQDSRTVICKRYNMKSFWHALNRAFRVSRGSQSWRNAHHLLDCGIATAKPIALHEHRYGPLRSRTWLFMEKITGEEPTSILNAGVKNKSNEFKLIINDFVRLFEKMVLERVSHGDMKISNFIYSEKILYVIDLDSMKTHKTAASFTKSFSRDMRRFFKNWQTSPRLRKAFYDALSVTNVAEYLPSK